MRTSLPDQYIYGAASTDGGITWSKPAMQFEGSGRPSVTKLSNGNLLFVSRRSAIPQKTVYRISKDNGISWSEEVSTDADSYVNEYGGSTEIGGKAYIVYFVETAPNASSDVRLTEITTSFILQKLHLYARVVNVPSDQHHAKVHSVADHTDVARSKFFPITNVSGTAGTDSQDGYGGRLLDNAVLNNIIMILRVPDDFVSFTALKLVFLPLADGNMYWAMDGDFAANNENRVIHTFSSGYGETTVGGFFIRERTTTTPADLSNLALGDVIGLRILRDATNALDTLEGKVIALGLLLEYTAHQ